MVVDGRGPLTPEPASSAGVDGTAGALRDEPLPDGPMAERTDLEAVEPASEPETAPSSARVEIAPLPAGVPPRTPAAKESPPEPRHPDDRATGSVRPVTGPSLLGGGTRGRVGLRERVSSADGPGLSPALTAVFGGLFGLATVASIFALLIQVFPVTEQRTELPTSPSDGATAEAARAEQPPAPSSRKRVRTPLPGPWRLSTLKDDKGIRIVSGEMERRAFVNALADGGVPKPEVYRILKAMEGVVKLDRPGKHDKFSVAMSLPAKRVVAFEYETGPIEIYQAREDEQGLLRGTQLDMKVAYADVTGAFYIAKDVSRGVAVSEFEEGILEAVDAAFRGRISSEAFEEGGTVRAVVTEMTALGLFARYDHAKVVEYRPPDPSQPAWRAYYFEGNTYKGYVDEKGRAPSQNGWRSPVPGAPMTSPFNPKRMHPILKKVMPHQGTDFGASAGTPVYAAFRGKISSVGFSGGYGNLVIVDHPGDIQTYYAHLSRFAAGIKGGMRVGTHQLIGYVGSTGRSTGPHLHFGAKRAGKWFDPMSLHLDAWRPLPAADRASFLALKQQLDAQIEAIPLPEPVPDEAPPTEEDASAESPSAADDGSEGEANEPEDESSEADEQPEEAPQPSAPRKSGPSSPGSLLEGEDLSVEPE